MDSIQSGGSFSLVEFEQLDNVATPLHVHHAVDEGFVILEGRFEFESDGEAFEAAPPASYSCRAASLIVTRSLANAVES